MRQLKFVLMVLALGLPVAGPVHSQGSPPPEEDVFAEKDPLEGRVLGERVEITLTNGSLFRGELRAIFKDRIKVDLSYEGTNVDGMMSFERKKIRQCQVLPALTADERGRIAAAREAAKGTAAAAAAATEEPAEPKEGDEKKEESAEEKRKAELEALLAAYPPEVWTERRYAEILSTDPARRTPEEQGLVDKYTDWLEAKKMKAAAERAKILETYPPGDEWNEQKYESLQSKLAVFGIPCSAEEQFFVENFADWKTAKAEKEAADKKAAEKKAEEEKKKAEEAKKAEEEAAKAAEEGK
ncbi:MAG: hypothetical protein HYY93_16665 [Planctomycetes bacterium]|nr:hypothetical protein [Planctomycetota bacterium]